KLIHETIRRMVNDMVLDLIGETRSNIARSGVASLDDVRRAGRLVAYSEDMATRLQSLKRFLRDKLYWHYQVLRMTGKARRIIDDLFSAFMADPRLLPPQ